MVGVPVLKTANSLQFLFQALGLPIRPDYWDAQLRVEAEPTERDRILLVGLGALDNFDIVRPEPDDDFETPIEELIRDEDSDTVEEYSNDELLAEEYLVPDQNLDIDPELADLIAGEEEEEEL